MSMPNKDIRSLLARALVAARGTDATRGSPELATALALIAIGHVLVDATTETGEFKTVQCE